MKLNVLASTSGVLEDSYREYGYDEHFATEVEANARRDVLNEATCAVDLGINPLDTTGATQERFNNSTPDTTGNWIQAVTTSLHRLEEPATPYWVTGTWHQRFNKES